MEGTDDVAVDVRMRVFDRVADTGLGCKVHYPVELLVCKQPFHACAVGKVDAVHREAVETIEQRGARLFQRDVVVRVEIIETYDSFAALQQLPGSDTADESRCSGYQYLHASFLSGHVRAGRRQGRWVRG